MTSYQLLISVLENSYMTGRNINIDGGKSLE